MVRGRDRERERGRGSKRDRRVLTPGVAVVFAGFNPANLRLDVPREVFPADQNAMFALIPFDDEGNMITMWGNQRLSLCICCQCNSSYSGAFLPGYGAYMLSVPLSLSWINQTSMTTTFELSWFNRSANATVPLQGYNNTISVLPGTCGGSSVLDDCRRR